jgi:hypothetical protein
MSVPKSVSEYMRQIGRKGGKAGKGKAKKRTPAQYKELARIRKAKRTAR